MEVIYAKTERDTVNKTVHDGFQRLCIMHYGYQINALNRPGTFKNTFFVLQNFPSVLFLFSPRTILKKMETVFIQTFPGQTKSLMVSLKVAFYVHF